MTKKTVNLDEIKEIDTNLSPYVFCDWLSFTFPYVDLRHLHKADLSDMRFAPVPVHPSRKNGRKLKFRKMPKPNYKLVKNDEEKKRKLEDIYKQQFNVMLHDRLEVFCLIVLGLRLGNWREKGLNGYENSAGLYIPNTTKRVGFVALGGNNGTCFFQIEGAGCKHVFNHTDGFRLHWWLTIVGVTRLSRIDLAIDDFHEMFGREYAKKAYCDDAFRTSAFGRAPNGGERVVVSPNGEIVNESFEVGNRQSTVYWRIYNKAAQLGLDFFWFRSEVELKKVSIDVLLNISGYFAGSCAYSASIISSTPVKIVSNKKKACLDIHSQIRWARRQVGKTLFDIANHFNGDLEKTFGILANGNPDGDSIQLNDKFVLPNVYKKLMIEILEK